MFYSHLAMSFYSEIASRMNVRISCSWNVYVSHLCRQISRCCTMVYAYEPGGCKIFLRAMCWCFEVWCQSWTCQQFDDIEKKSLFRLNFNFLTCTMHPLSVQVPFDMYKRICFQYKYHLTGFQRATLILNCSCYYWTCKWITDHINDG